MASTWLPHHIVYTLAHNNLLMVDIGAPQGICCAADKQATKFTVYYESCTTPITSLLATISGVNWPHDFRNRDLISQ